MVPNLLAPGTSFTEDNFPTGRGWGEGGGFRMIQVHHIYCSLYFYLFLFLGFPGGSDGKESDSNEETWVQSLGLEDPLEREMATTSILAWRIP